MRWSVFFKSSSRLRLLTQIALHPAKSAPFHGVFLEIEVGRRSYSGKILSSFDDAENGNHV